jgi:hypothetical protein
MGDRANVVLKQGEEQICLYTHWAGSELELIAKEALKRGQKRLDDFPYLSRIVFCEMIKNDVMGETGYGISALVGDGKDRVITIDCDEQTIKLFNGDELNLIEFIK